MNLEELGYNKKNEKYLKDNNLSDFETGRVIAEHKERYIVKTVKGDFNAEITGNLRFTAKSREDFPAVGDWVAVTTYEPDLAIIHKILPRSSLIKRQAVGQPGEIQVIAANIDYAFLVQAVDRDFNINRLERYLTICNSSKVRPIIVLSKTDLIEGKQTYGDFRTDKSKDQKCPGYCDQQRDTGWLWSFKRDYGKGEDLLHAWILRRRQINTIEQPFRQNCYADRFNKPEYK